MTRTHRHSRRLQQKTRRKAKRRKARAKDRTGQKAGSIAIHSRLPGLEGTEIGAMDIVVDARRKQEHPAEIAVTVHGRRDGRTISWVIETGFGGHTPRMGYQVVSGGQLDEPAPMTWVCELPRAPDPERPPEPSPNEAT